MINRSRSIRNIALVSHMYDYFAGSTRSSAKVKARGRRRVGKIRLKVYDLVRKRLQKKAQNEWLVA